MISILTKFILILTFFLFGESKKEKDLEQFYVSIKSDTVVVNDSIQTRAFEILTHKCNVCHVNRNRRRVFTQDNMNNWSNEVYKQVFIKKRMPKGKKNKLTSKEYQNLMTWISTIKNKENGNQL